MVVRTAITDQKHTRGCRRLNSLVLTRNGLPANIAVKLLGWCRHAKVRHEGIRFQYDNETLEVG